MSPEALIRMGFYFGSVVMFVVGVHAGIVGSYVEGGYDLALMATFWKIAGLGLNG